MFLHLSVIRFTGLGAGSLSRGVTVQWGLCWGDVSVQGDLCRTVEEGAVRILLECILVYSNVESIISTIYQNIILSYPERH